jgi:hypothetical protein
MEDITFPEIPETPFVTEVTRTFFVTAAASAATFGVLGVALWVWSKFFSKDGDLEPLPKS